MVATDVIKEYLVRLGFDVDNPAQARVRQALKELENSLSALSKNQATNILIKGMLGYVGAVAAAVTATAALMNKVAETDLEYQKIALRMHMTTDTAKQLTIAQKALGASLEEIVWNPELRSHYHELRQIVQAAGPPADAREQFQFIRSVGFELTKLKVTGQMVVENVVYRLAKMLGRDMKELKKWLADLRKWIIDNLPEISQKIAKVLREIISMGQTLIFVLKGIYTGVRNVVEVLPDAAKGIVALIAAISLGLKLNPALVALAAFFIMIQDYYTWKKAKDLRLDPNEYSAFGSMWENLEGTFDSLSLSLKNLRTSFDLIGETDFKINLWNAFAGAVKGVATAVSTVALGLTTIANVAATTVGFFALHNQLKENFERDQKILREKYNIKDTDKAGNIIPYEKQPPEFRKEMKALEDRYNLTWNAIRTGLHDDFLSSMGEAVDQYGKGLEGMWLGEYSPKSAARDMNKKRTQAVTPSNAPQIPANISPKDAKRYGVSKKFAEAINTDKTSGYDSTYTYWDIAINGDIILPNVRNFTDLPAELQKKARENKNMQSIK